MFTKFAPALVLIASALGATNAMAVERWQNVVNCTQVDYTMGGPMIHVGIKANVANRRVVAVVNSTIANPHAPRPRPMTVEISNRFVKRSFDHFVGPGFALRISLDSLLPTTTHMAEARISSLAGGRTVRMSCEYLVHAL